MVAGTFMTTYGYCCNRFRTHENDLLRMAFAGSLANLVVESMFHVVDTVNIRTKLSETPISSLSMVQKIYAKEGLYGFSKGFSACFYGSAICGFVYFSLYKLFKTHFKEKAEP